MGFTNLIGAYRSLLISSLDLLNTKISSSETQWPAIRSPHQPVKMPYLTHNEILSIFGELGKVPRGYESFFNHVDDNVHWEITGQSALSGVWRSKSQFLDNVWLPIVRLISDPGPIFEIASPESITSNKEGWLSIELKTKNTRTKLGNRIYRQHYCWHCKFNATRKIIQVRSFFDTSLAEAILLDEKYRQEALAILPSDGKHTGWTSRITTY